LTARLVQELLAISLSFLVQQLMVSFVVQDQHQLAQTNPAKSRMRTMNARPTMPPISQPAPGGSFLILRTMIVVVS
jgi:hypothetical protein